MPKKQTTQKVITPVAADNSHVRSDYDIYLLKQGNHFGLYKKLGAHLVGENGQTGARFAVWAPGARCVALIGDFNNWDDTAHPLSARPDVFMGGEFGQWSEWNHETSLAGHLLNDPAHHGIQRWTQDLNHFCRRTPARYERDFESDGFEWVDNHDWENSVLAFLRKGRQADDGVLVVCNFTPEPRRKFRVGVPRAGYWREVLNSDSREYGVAAWVISARSNRCPQRSAAAFIPCR